MKYEEQVRIGSRTYIRYHPGEELEGCMSDEFFNEIFSSRLYVDKKVMTSSWNQFFQNDIMYRMSMELVEGYKLRNKKILVSFDTGREPLRRLKKKLTSGAELILQSESRFAVVLVKRNKNIKVIVFDLDRIL